MDITPTPQSNVGGVQPQQVQPSQSQYQGQPLDPSIVALTKAIGQAETPKQYGTPAAYTTPSGDPGSPASAYQFTPGFIDKWGPSVLDRTTCTSLTIIPTWKTGTTEFM